MVYTRSMTTKKIITASNIDSITTNINHLAEESTQSKSDMSDSLDISNQHINYNSEDEYISDSSDTENDDIDLVIFDEFIEAIYDQSFLSESFLLSDFNTRIWQMYISRILYCNSEKCDENIAIKLINAIKLQQKITISNVEKYVDTCHFCNKIKTISKEIKLCGTVQITETTLKCGQFCAKRLTHILHFYSSIQNFLQNHHKSMQDVLSDFLKQLNNSIDECSV